MQEQQSPQISSCIVSCLVAALGWHRSRLPSWSTMVLDELGWPKPLPVIQM